MFSYGLLLFLELHLKYSLCVGEEVLSFSVVVACLSVTVLNSDSTPFPPLLLQLSLMGNVVGMCLLLRDGWKQGNSTENHWFRKLCYVSN